LILTTHEESRLAKVKYVSSEAHKDDDEGALLQDIGRMVNGKRQMSEVGRIQAAKKGTTKGPLDILFYQNPQKTLGKGKKINMKDDLVRKQDKRLTNI